MDQDAQWMLEQKELLREIRDAVRSGSMGHGAASGGGLASGPQRPGATFVHAQAMADRALSGEWNTLGWGNAYRSQFRSSFFGDLGAMTGLSRAPETLTQSEFQAIGGASVASRVSGAALGMLAPGFNARTSALADEIYANSSRFIRFGSNAAGETGVGFGYTAARSLSRQIGLEALGDLRMSGKDYNTITSLGMQSGQFDQSDSTDDFKRKLRELASATGDLTRALHMSVQEVGTAMGNLRQLGVSNVGQQRNIMMGIGASAAVAGVSASEMMAVAGGVGSMGMGMGLNAQTGIGVGAGNMAMVRGLAQAGVINPALVAMGGGAQAVAQNISAAQMGFASSNAGMLAFMGGAGGGGNTVDAMMRGISSVTGTFGGLMSMDYDRVNNLSSMTPGQLNNMFRGSVETRLGMMGISDMTSRTARGAAFRVARGMGMEESAARIYANANFSSEGRRGSDILQMEELQAKQVSEQKIAYDRYLSNNSFAGRVRSGVQGVELGFGSLIDSGMRGLDRLVGQNLGDQFGSQASGAVRGLTATHMGVEDIADSLIGGAAAEKITPAKASAVRVRHSNASSLRSVGWGVGAMAVGAAAAAAIPTGGLSLVGLGVGLAASTAMSALGIWNSRDSEDEFFGGDASNMWDVSAAARSSNGADGKALIKAGKMKGQAWEQLTAKLNRTKMDGAEFRDFSNLANQAVSENKLGATGFQDVMNAFRAVGGDVVIPDSTDLSANGMSSVQDSAIKHLFSGVDVGANLASPDNARKVSAFLKASISGGDVSGTLLEDLSSALGGAEAVDKFRGVVNAQLSTSSGKAELAAAAEGFSVTGKQVGKAELNRRFMTAMDLAGTRLGDMGGDTAKGARAELAKAQEGKTSFFELLNNGKFNEVARNGQLGPIFSAAASVKSDAELDKMGSQQIIDMYHLDATKDTLDVARANMKKGGVSTQQGVEAMILNSKAAKSEQADTNSLESARLLRDAARLLGQLDGKLNAPEKK
jgi:hypothetical protein